MLAQNSFEHKGLFAGRELGGVACFEGSVRRATLGDDEVVRVVEVVTACVDSLDGVLGALWIVGIFHTSRQAWVGLALALL